MSIVYNPWVLIEIKCRECFPRTCNFRDEWPVPICSQEIKIHSIRVLSGPLQRNIRKHWRCRKLWDFSSGPVWQKTMTNFKSDSVWVLMTWQKLISPTMPHAIDEPANGTPQLSSHLFLHANWICWFSNFQIYIYPWNLKSVFLNKGLLFIILHKDISQMSCSTKSLVEHHNVITRVQTTSMKM